VSCRHRLAELPLHDVRPRACLERDPGIGMARLLDRDLWDAGDGDGSLPAAEERIGMDHGPSGSVPIHERSRDAADFGPKLFEDDFLRGSTERILTGPAAGRPTSMPAWELPRSRRRSSSGRSTSSPSTRRGRRAEASRGAYGKPSARYRGRRRTRSGASPARPRSLRTSAARSVRARRASLGSRRRPLFVGSSSSSSSTIRSSSASGLPVDAAAVKIAGPFARLHGRHDATRFPRSQTGPPAAIGTT
jgi:hypothetical protein